MKNFIIHFTEDQRDGVLALLSSSNDIIINSVQTNRAGITIQQENADEIFDRIIHTLERDRLVTTHRFTEG